jgi:ABC-type transporter Mla subunit MlaD
MTRPLVKRRSLVRSRTLAGARPLGRFALLGLLLVLALALSACSDNSHTRVTTGTYAGESGQNAPYLNVGPLIYEVQLSRELNPYDTEDASYLADLTPAQAKLEPGEEWFAVFLQVYNETSTSHPAATNISISDTQENIYTPIVPPLTNEFAYRAGLVPPKGRIPALDTVAANGPTQGAVLLFKIKVVSLDNRPIEIKIVDPNNPTQTASAELDV